MDRQLELAQAKAHVRHGEDLVARQRDMIERLSIDGMRVTLAQQLLENLELSLRGMRDHLELVLREADDDARADARRRRSIS